MMHDFSRRELIAAAATACGCALCPNLMAFAAERAGEPVDVGVPGDFAHEGVYGGWVAKGFFLIRQGKRLYASSSACTHRSEGRLVSKGEKLVCPRHGSQFKLTGEVNRGPARRALPRFGISINNSGRILVDASKRYDEGEWDHAGSFVNIA